jgi:hypothetical protein
VQSVNVCSFFPPKPEKIDLETPDQDLYLPGSENIIKIKVNNSDLAKESKIQPETQPPPKMETLQFENIEIPQSTSQVPFGLFFVIF